MTVAKVWWDASSGSSGLPDDGVPPAADALLNDGGALTFGRHRDAHIRIGHGADFDESVPRWWGELSWHRGRLHIANLSENWGFELVPVDDLATSLMVVPVGAMVSPSMTRFDIVAEAPHSRHTMRVACVRPAAFVIPLGESVSSFDDPPSFLPFRLTDPQRSVGREIVAAMRTGRTRRPSYEEIAASAYRSKRRVRELVAEMDTQFIMNGLVRSDAASDALDRVAAVISKHGSLLR